MTAPRPRTAVIDEAWRKAAGDAAVSTGSDVLAVMSGRDGRPLARTVKCLIDPLVLRLRAKPELGKPLLDATASAEVAALIAGAAPTIADSARWFAELKAARRAAGITGGSIQEQYFPRAFELAVAYGTPGDGAAAIAAETIDDIHRPRAGMTVDDLAEYLDRHHAELDAALDNVWTNAKRTVADETGRDVAHVVDIVLAADADPAERQARWTDLTTSGVPDRVGVGLFEAGAPIDDLLAACGVTIAEPDRAPALSASTPVTVPPLRGNAGGLPLDRPIATRVTTTLRRSRDRESLPPIAGLVDDEINRSRQPWALDGATWRAAMLLGVVVAAQLHPLAPRPGPHGFAEAMSRRLAAQAHILYNRRFLLSGAPVDGELSTELREFWRPYLGRLWVRLHGRSVLEPWTATTEFDAVALLDLLEGIARSVSYDQRSRIRAAIEKAAR